MNRPILCVQHKKPLWNIESSNELASQFKRSQFCFGLDALMIVKVDVVIYQLSCFCESIDLIDRKEFEYTGKEYNSINLSEYLMGSSFTILGYIDPPKP